MFSLKISALAAVCLSATLAHAQVPTALTPILAVDTFESIGILPDTDAVQNNGAVFRKLYTVPANRVFRLTDLSIDSRNANSSPNPCFFEVWRGTETQAVSPAWSRVRIFTTATYDRSWITGPQFNAGEVLWIIGRFDPLNVGLRICTRNDPNIATELRYALRGYVARQPNP